MHLVRLSYLLLTRVVAVLPCSVMVISEVKCGSGIILIVISWSCPVGSVFCYSSFFVFFFFKQKTAYEITV